MQRTGLSNTLRGLGRVSEQSNTLGDAHTSKVLVVQNFQLLRTLIFFYIPIH